MCGLFLKMIFTSRKLINHVSMHRTKSHERYHFKLVHIFKVPKMVYKLFTDQAQNRQENKKQHKTNSTFKTHYLHSFFCTSSLKGKKTSYKHGKGWVKTGNGNYHTKKLNKVSINSCWFHYKLIDFNLSVY